MYENNAHDLMVIYRLDIACIATSDNYHLLSPISRFLSSISKPPNNQCKKFDQAILVLAIICVYESPPKSRPMPNPKLNAK